LFLFLFYTQNFFKKKLPRNSSTGRTGWRCGGKAHAQATGARVAGQLHLEPRGSRAHRLCASDGALRRPARWTRAAQWCRRRRALPQTARARPWPHAPAAAPPPRGGKKKQQQHDAARKPYNVMFFVNDACFSSTHFSSFSGLHLSFLNFFFFFFFFIYF
jgi:hypothetical protein